MSDLNAEFERDMRADSIEYTRKTGTPPTRYLQMIQAHGAVETARRLALNPHFHEGFTRAWEHACLDLTAEYLMVYGRGGRYRPLFTQEEVTAAARKLKQVGVTAQIGE